MSSANTAVMASYTDAIADLPEEAFLGSLLFFSICQADVNLVNANRDLTAAGLSTEGLRKMLRPVDAFRKASRRIEHTFAPDDGIRSTVMVRPVGEDGEQAYRHVVLERAIVKQGQKRRVFYDKVAELTFTRGQKVNGNYVNHGVECRRSVIADLKDFEDRWIAEQLATYEDHYDHLLHYMDSHAVRTFVREYIYRLSGTCVKESGGLYFVKQEHADEIRRLAAWVRSVGSEFHTLPLLNLGDQRAMILEAFEEETIVEVERAMAEVSRILSEPDRKIEEKTFDAYADRAAALAAKVQEYHNMLGTRADRAAAEIDMYGQQVLALSSRIKVRA